MYLLFYACARIAYARGIMRIFANEVVAIVNEGADNSTLANALESLVRAGRVTAQEDCEARSVVIYEKDGAMHAYVGNLSGRMIDFFLKNEGFIFI